MNVSKNKLSCFYVKRLLIMKNPLYTIPFLFICLLFSCGKKDSPVTKDKVTITSFKIDTTATPLFKEPFNGDATSYTNVVLIPDVNAAAVVKFSAATLPSSYAGNLSFTIKNDDGTPASASSYTISGNQLMFKVPGLYRITAMVAAGAGNDASSTSSEILLQVAPNVPDDKLRVILKNINTLHFIGEILNITGASGPSILDLSNKGLQSLEGIGYLSGINSLDCSSNSLVSLDVSKLTDLVFFLCSTNHITNLKVQGLTN